MADWIEIIGWAAIIIGIILIIVTIIIYSSKRKGRKLEGWHTTLLVIGLVLLVIGLIIIIWKALAPSLPPQMNNRHFIM